MLTIHLALLILGMVCFLGAALDVKFYRITLQPLGLFFWVLAIVLWGR